jgi:alpha-beta hydrolase superfamily lysophospholipase
VKTDEVRFFSEGTELSALWRTPAAAANGRLPAVVQGPGWFGTKEARLYEPYHRALTKAGIGVLIIDHRGFRAGDPPESISLAGQVQDLRNALTYLTTRDDVDAGVLGLFGNGATGAGNVVLAAAVDDRVRAVVAQFPIADGKRWLRGMRRDAEWAEFLEQLAADRAERVRSGRGRLVDPTREITLSSPERERTGVKADIADRVPPRAPLAVADELLTYRPAAAARDVRAPMLLVALEGDVVTPESHAIDIYDAARCTKSLVMQHGTTHYASYARYGELVREQILDWYAEHLAHRPLSRQSEAGRS